MILAADVGGTKTNVALFREDADQLGTPLNQKSFPSKHYESLDAIISEYIAERPADITLACFGIAERSVEPGERLPTGPHCLR